ncbi:MAG: SDR family NAD(P)-dependent oxidoreductase [Ilumatobacteraceae bacterium]
MEIRGRHILITGASRGIGAAIARELAQRGARLTLVARSTGPLSAVADEVGGSAVVADLMDRAQLDGLLDRVEKVNGPIDVLVNNAGIEHTKNFLDTDATEIDDVALLNFVVPLQLCRVVLPGMVQRERGHIVNISSMASTGGFPGLSVYAGTKAGLSQFTRIVRQDLKNTPIRLTAVEIGPVPTELFDNIRYQPTIDCFARLRKIQLMPNVAATSVAIGVANGIEKGKRAVWLPRRAFLFPMLVGLPQRIVEPLIRGIGP